MLRIVEQTERKACMALEHQQAMIVSARFPMVEIYRRENGKWVSSVFDEHDEITLASLGLHFPCRALYEDIDFSEETGV
ncbi:MAG: hypothetical protein ACREBW_04735 [Candidatus Micrarchaeaceae archaeon]